MKKALLGGVGVALALSFASVANATAFTAADMNIALGVGGTISATFGNSGIPLGEFTDTFSFTIGADGTGSGSAVTTASFLGDVSDLDFLEVSINGIGSTGTGNGLNEVRFLNDIPITAGVLNTITIRGLSRGNGSYGANATFSPTVPEPASWAMMITGFGLVGAMARRRTGKVKLAFA